jgi:hypothetical protein
MEPLYPVDRMVFSRTITAPTNLREQVDRDATTLAMFMKYSSQEARSGMGISTKKPGETRDDLRPLPTPSFPGRLIGLLEHDIFLTKEEIAALMAGLLESNAPATGTIRLSEWAKQNADILGRANASEMRRRRRRDVSYTDVLSH